MPFAIIKTGGKQFVVEQGTTVRIPSLAADPGKSIEIDALLTGGAEGFARLWVRPKSPQLWSNTAGAQSFWCLRKSDANITSALRDTGRVIQRYELIRLARR